MNCVRLFLKLCATADSKVYLCHNKAYVPGGNLGDLSKKTFKEVWFLKKAKRIFAQYDVTKECRNHCVYDERNIFINNMLVPGGIHVNFI